MPMPAAALRKRSEAWQARREARLLVDPSWPLAIGVPTGSQLRWLIRINRHTAASVARMLGVSRSAVGHWVRGEVRIPCAAYELLLLKLDAHPYLTLQGRASLRLR